MSNELGTLAYQVYEPHWVVVLATAITFIYLVAAILTFFTAMNHKDDDT